MYIGTPEAWSLAAPPATKPAVKPYQAPITNGAQYIEESDADKILTILSGPPFQNFTQSVMGVQAGPKLPKNFLRIVSSPKDVPTHLRDRFVKVGNKVVGGTIDRANGTIYMLPAPGRRSDTRLEFALHEGVHLLAHPFMSLVDERTFQTKYGRACTTGTDVGTFQRKYCFGLGEGATQVITERIMKAQGISKSSEETYKEFLPPVQKLIDIFSLEKFVRAYFWGEVKEFTDAMELRWGTDAWRNLANFTSAKDHKRALTYIDQLELAYIKRRGPKGDYPVVSRFKSYA